MRRQLLRVLFTLSVFLSITISAFGQADVSSATVKGTVIDPQGAAVTNAVVNVKDLGSRRDPHSHDRFERRVSGAAGASRSPRHNGRSVRLRAILCSKTFNSPSGRPRPSTIKLQVAGVKTEMVVTTSAPLIEIERTQQANTIESRQIENLSNVGRNFQSLCLHSAGRVEFERPAGSARRTHYGLQYLRILDWRQQRAQQSDHG